MTALPATPTRPLGPDVCPFVLQSELDLEKGSEMRKWVLSGILASEETYLSHLEARLLVRGRRGAGRAGSAAMEAWEQPRLPPGIPANTRRRAGHGLGRRGRPSPGEGAVGALVRHRAQLSRLHVFVAAEI